MCFSSAAEFLAPSRGGASLQPACAELYLAEHLKKYRNDKHKWQYRETLQRASKAFGELSIGQIDAPMVIKFLTPIWQQTPETAARIRGRIERVITATSEMART